MLLCDSLWLVLNSTHCSVCAFFRSPEAKKRKALPNGPGTSDRPSAKKAKTAESSSEESSSDDEEAAVAAKAAPTGTHSSVLLIYAI